jgi:hypothetical protein
MTPPRALGRLLVALLIADAALAWLAIQGAFLFLEIVWRALAATENWRPLVEAHARQFTWLRTLEAAAWLTTAALFVVWLRRVRSALALEGRLVGRASPVRPLRLMLETWRAAVPGRAASRMPPLLGWWWALAWIALGLETWALVRRLAAGTALEMGRGLMLVVVASGLELATAVLTVFVVMAVQGGLAPPPSAARA